MQTLRPHSAQQEKTPQEKTQQETAQQQTARQGPPARLIDQTDLHEHYAADWLEPGGVRVNFVASIDGGISVAGRSRGLQTPGDNKVFAALRDLADVVLIGSGTAAAEGYRPATPSDERRQLRQRFGLASAPSIAVLSASLDLDLSSPLYAAADADAPTLVITGSNAPMHRRNDIIDLAGGVSGLQLIEVPAGPDGGVDVASAVAELRERGLRRILCEGGPRVFDSALRARVVDELCLSVSPMLVGPGSPRIVAGPDWPDEFLPQLRLVGLLTEDDALFCRYRAQH